MFARKLGMAIAAGSLLASVAAFAGSVPQDFLVKLTITPECVVAAGSDISFPATGYLDSNVDAAGSIKVGCTEGTQPTIKLNNGTNSSSCGGSRCMKSATTSDFVKYDLYTNDTRTTAWPALGVTGPAGTGAVSGGAGVANNPVDIYGRVPPQTTPTPATDYTDTVTATVEF
jgi:spore coat protein U-like protein